MGIGTASPTHPLTVQAGTASNSPLLGFYSPAGTDKYNFSLADGGLNLSESSVAGGRLFVQDATGRVGVGLTAPAQLLDVNGGAAVRGVLGVGTPTPAASAALEVSSISKGLLPPRLSLAQRDAIPSPAVGLLLYNADMGKLNVWDGTAWTAPINPLQPLQNPAVSFGYTGAAQTYTVPDGVTSLYIEANGAQGNSGPFYSGGLGARVQATLAVTPGETLTIYVGGIGGYNGGGRSLANTRFNGGGASDVRRSAAAPSTDLTERLLVAAGGGGGTNQDVGGPGGAPNGGKGGGQGGSQLGSTVGGDGATQTSGGNDGGALGQGGTIGSFSLNFGGGGGGGYYGGGAAPNLGGNNSGGGGGSSWVTPTGATNVAMAAGAKTGDGTVFVSPGIVYTYPFLDGRNISGTWRTSGPSVFRPTGNVGIGSALPPQRLAVAGGIVALAGEPIAVQGAHVQWNRSGFEGETWLLNQNGLGAGGLRFGQSDAVSTGANSVAEWARFDGNGNLGLGTTSPDARLDVESSAPQQLILTSTSADPSGVLTLSVPATNSAGPTASEYVLFRKAGHPTPIGSITANLATNTVSYNTASDRRLKEHITPTRYGLPELLRLQVKDYNFIGSAARHRTTGLLAQDLYQVYPPAVLPGDTGPTLTRAWAVDYGKLTPLLIQAVQDQQRLMDQQQTEIDALQAQATSAETQAAQTTATLETIEARLRRLEAGSARAQR